MALFTFNIISFKKFQKMLNNKTSDAFIHIACFISLTSLTNQSTILQLPQPQLSGHNSSMFRARHIHSFYVHC